MTIPNGVRIGIASGLVAAGLGAFVRLYRPWHLRWGATDEEQDVQPGDVVPIGPGGGGLRVKDFVRGEWLLWWDGIGHSTWLWSLEQIAPEILRDAAQTVGEGVGGAAPQT